MKYSLQDIYKAVVINGRNIDDFISYYGSFDQYLKDDNSYSLFLQQQVKQGDGTMINFFNAIAAYIGDENLLDKIYARQSQVRGQASANPWPNAPSRPPRQEKRFRVFASIAHIDEGTDHHSRPSFVRSLFS